MKDLLEDLLFSGISELFCQFAHDIKNSKTTILLTAPPDIIGVLSLAPLEASLLDANISYRRRFTKKPNEYGPSINITNSDESSGPFLDSNTNSLFLSDLIVDGLTGTFGNSKKGPLTTISQAHALAQKICPSSPRLRKLRPWILSGNWLDDSLDNTYDPVFSKLKDILKNEGSIRIVPITEVNLPYMENLTWIDKKYFKEIIANWPNLNFKEKSNSLSILAKPVLNQNLPSTARAEELIWNRILGPGWDTDIAGQIYFQIIKWNKNKEIFTSMELLDDLLKNGVLN